MEINRVRFQDFGKDHPLRTAWHASGNVEPDENEQAKEEFIQAVQRLAQLLRIDYDTLAFFSFRWFQAEAITMLHSDARVLEWAKKRNDANPEKRRALLEDHFALFKSFGLVEDAILERCPTAAKREIEGRH